MCVKCVYICLSGLHPSAVCWILRRTRTLKMRRSSNKRNVQLSRINSIKLDSEFPSLPTCYRHYFIISLYQWYNLHFFPLMLLSGLWRLIITITIFSSLSKFKPYFTFHWLNETIICTRTNVYFVLNRP